MNPIFISFQIQLFVFIAGYIYASKKEKSIQKSKKSFIIKKTKRILLPSTVYSLIYYVLFYKIDNKVNIVNFIYVILIGMGHLWFLPMLYGCYIIAKVTDIKILNNQKKVVSITLLILSILSFCMPQYLRINEICKNLIYFYLGYCCWKNKKNIIDKYIKPKYCIASIIIFVSVLCFVIMGKNCIDINTNGSNIIFIKIVRLIIVSIMHLLLEISGIISIFVCVNYYLMVLSKSTPPIVLAANKYCYGIYIYHQFVLVYLLTYTNIVAINSIFLPFILIIISIIVSSLCTALTLRTKFGNIIIG